MLKSHTSSDPQKILIVDDDQGHRFMARESLEGAGFIVEEVADGKAALHAVHRFHPDLVLLDVVMPELDGIDVCRQLRQTSEFMNLPILMVTGLDDMESIESAFRAGATGFITKPINWALLVYHIKYILRSSLVEQELQHARNLLKIAGVPA